MSDLIWKSNGGQGTAEVVVGETRYSFADGVPVDVPNEHYAACVTALQALPDTLSAGAGDPEI